MREETERVRILRRVFSNPWAFRIVHPNAVELSNFRAVTEGVCTAT